MVDAITPIRLIPLSEVVTDIDDVDDIERRVLDLCIAQRVPTFIITPSNTVAVAYEWVKSEKPILMRVGEAEDGEARTLPVGHIYPINPVANTSVAYLGLDASDLKEIRDASRITKEWFSSGLKAHPRGGFERELYEGVSLCRPPHLDLRAEYPLRPEDAQKRLVFQVKVADIFVSVDSISMLKRDLRAASSVVDRWGHKEDAPSVFLIYSAAQKFAGAKYDFDAIREWLIANDKNKVFKGKIADFAARLIKKDVVIKRKKLQPDRIARDKIVKNALGRNYTEDVASDRLSLLHLATDSWLHDKRNPGGSQAIPGRNLRGFLFDLGFEDSVKDSQECQVAYLCRVIENVPGWRHISTEKDAAAKVKSSKRPKPI